ncbi:MAG TPA: vWA domain-containing protein [Terriglobales bacterium]|nr:vWA domain-containing protein [Terriglobales bacterium]
MSAPAAPERFDPWAGNRGRGARWLVLSAAIHVGLLVLLATVTLTVMQNVEKIGVTVVDDTAIDEAFEGEPSLEDLQGALVPEKAAPQRAAPGAPVISNVRAPALPRLAGLGAAPKLGTNPNLAAVSAGASFGTGGGGLGGLGGSFGNYVGGLRKVGLDVVLVIDATSSMQFVIDEVREKLKQMVAKLHQLVPTARIGIVVYRDQGDEFVTKWTDLSFHTDKLHSFLSNITAQGGGDFEEAVHQALDTAIHDLTWRKKAKRVIILVGGSPPHPEDVGEVERMVASFQSDLSVVSAIDVTREAFRRYDLGVWRAIHGKKEYQPSPLPDYQKETARIFAEIAKQGGGEMVLLDEDKALIRQILQVTFGSRWKTEMKQFLDELS